MIAKYPGTCFACNKPIHRGELINFHGRGRAEHATQCNADQAAKDFKVSNVRFNAPKPSQEDYPCSDMGYEDQCARQCGF